MSGDSSGSCPLAIQPLIPVAGPWVVDTVQMWTQEKAGLRTVLGKVIMIAFPLRVASRTVREFCMVPTYVFNCLFVMSIHREYPPSWLRPVSHAGAARRADAAI